MTRLRAAQIDAFLARANRAGAERTPLAGDASTRQYVRVDAADGRPKAMLMDAGGDHDVTLFAALTEHLRRLGYSAPEIYEHDGEAGLLLVEDLGDGLVASVLELDPALETACYETAVDLLCDLARHPPPMQVRYGNETRELPPYDLQALWQEAALLTEWWMPAARAPASPDLTAEYQQLVDDACRPAAGCRTALALRDYHAENLIWLPERAGLARLGLLDYQDALRGHPAYDLVSLLEDARRDTSDELRSAMAARYRQNSSMDGAEWEEFDYAYAALGAQRNLKIVGIFARLSARDGKHRYLDMLPRVWSHLMRDLAHPDLARLAAWVKRYVPPPDAAAIARARRP